VATSADCRFVLISVVPETLRSDMAPVPCHYPAANTLVRPSIHIFCSTCRGVNPLNNYEKARFPGALFKEDEPSTTDKAPTTDEASTSTGIVHDPEAPDIVEDVDNGHQSK
jgi:hypothetical protein